MSDFSTKIKFGLFDKIKVELFDKIKVELFDENENHEKFWQNDRSTKFYDVT